MIWESYYWKSDLLKIVKRLKKRKNQKRWPDASFANTEKDIMISAFMVRKLFDSGKVNSQIDDLPVGVKIYKSNGKKIHRLRNLSPEQYFDVENSEESKRKVRDICNQIIHSYVSVLIMNELGALQAYWFVSDYDKFKQLVEIQIDNYINILNQTSNYWPKSESYVFDKSKQDYTILHDV